MVPARRLDSRWGLLALVPSGLALLALIAGPIGTGAGIWDFRLGITLMRWAVYIGAPGLLLSLAVAAWALVAGSRRVLGEAVVAMALSGTAVAIPVAQYRTARAVPPINDITTDLSDPPVFVRAGRDEENGAAGVPYPGSDFAKQQAVAYPDLGTLRLSRPGAAVFDAALSTAREMPGWEVVLADRRAGRIEAVATTRWFRFRDDVAIRVRGSGPATEVDVRSRSRVGRSDLGANAARIRDFLERLRRAAGAF